MRPAHISRHAVDRAFLRWLVRDEEEAVEAIEHVLHCGTVKKSYREGELEYRVGTRQVYTRAGIVTTVTVHNHGRLRWMLKEFRRASKSKY